MHSVNITGWSFGSSEKIKLPSKHYPYIIVAHPRAVVTQSALNILQEEDPAAEIFVVADRYNFDNGDGSRLYTSRIHSISGKLRQQTTGAPSDVSTALKGRKGDRRENISTFTASKSKLDAQAPPPSPLSPPRKRGSAPVPRAAHNPPAPLVRSCCPRWTTSSRRRKSSSVSLPTSFPWTPRIKFSPPLPAVAESRALSHCPRRFPGHRE
jgi:hypothetical protein